MLSHQVIPSLPLSRTIRDLPRSPNHPFVFIPTLIRHADPLWQTRFGPHLRTVYQPIEALNFPKVQEGRRLAYPTTGSLVLRAKDSLRLFRKLLEKVLSKMLPLSPSRGTPCHCWLLHNPSRRRMFLINLF